MIIFRSWIVSISDLISSVLKPVFRIRIHLIRYGSGSSILGWIPIRIQFGSRVLMTKNWKKIHSWKRKLIFFTSKTTIFLSLGLHKGRPSYRRRLQLSKENIQHFKTWIFLIFFYFYGTFLPSWIRILNTDPDPLTWLNSDPIRIRIRNKRLL